MLTRLTLAGFLWYIMFAFLDDLLAGAVSRAFSPIWFLYLVSALWFTKAIISISKS